MTPARTVLDSTVDILRRHGLTTIFGNPGSNELPFLAGLPDDFTYILGLHEGVVMGMADGYAQASGKPVLVNLHAASGSGNAMGALTNAFVAHSPLVVLAGQQIRQTVGQNVMLANIDASLLPRPLVKYSHEPLSPQDVPRTMSNAIFAATTDPKGPVYVSVPYDDWAAPALEDDDLLPRRSVRTAGGLGPELLRDLATRLDKYKHPVLVLGPDVDAARAQPTAVKLAERLGAPVWIAPSAPRCPFPTTHANYRGVLFPGVTSVRGRLEGHDGVIVIGAPVMRYHRWEPGAFLPKGTDVIHITCDPDEAARAPYGDAIVASIGPALEALANAVTDRGVSLPPRVVEAIPESVGMVGEAVLDILSALSPPDVVYVNEATTLDQSFLNRVAITQPNSYHFPASGGLGFGLPCAVGVSLAKPDATVVAVIGDGSANYGLTALYSAAHHGTRTIFVIINNGTYGALRGFARALGAENAPGLDIPGIDFTSLAKGYGVPSQTIDTREQFIRAYKDALAAKGPVLIDTRVK